MPAEGCPWNEQRQATGKPQGRKPRGSSKDCWGRNRPMGIWRFRWGTSGLTELRGT